VPELNLEPEDQRNENSNDGVAVTGVNPISLRSSAKLGASVEIGFRPFDFIVLNFGIDGSRGVPCDFCNFCVDVFFAQHKQVFPLSRYS
jgi:hypothetical protein